MTEDKALDAAIRWIQRRESGKYLIASGRAMSDRAIDETTCCDVVHKPMTLDKPELWAVYMEIPTIEGRVNAFVEFDMCGAKVDEGTDVERHGENRSPTKVTSADL